MLRRALAARAISVGVLVWFLPLIYFALGPACSTTRPQEASVSPSPSAPPLVDSARAKTVISSLSATELFSIADAEAQAGFDILAPSQYYPMGFGRTYLRKAQDGSGTFSTTQYTYPPLAPQSIQVDAGPAAVFGEERYRRAEQRTIGDRRGWLLRNESNAIQFAFEYNDTPGSELWCVVQAPAEIGFDAFEDFVRSLK